MQLKLLYCRKKINPYGHVLTYKKAFVKSENNLFLLKKIYGKISGIFLATKKQ